jgi:hypothetical protein
VHAQCVGRAFSARVYPARLAPFIKRSQRHRQRSLPAQRSLSRRPSGPRRPWQRPLPPPCVTVCRPCPPPTRLSAITTSDDPDRRPGRRPGASRHARPWPRAGARSRLRPGAAVPGHGVGQLDRPPSVLIRACTAFAGPRRRHPRAAQAARSPGGVGLRRGAHTRNGQPAMASARQPGRAEAGDDPWTVSPDSRCADRFCAQVMCC